MSLSSGSRLGVYEIVGPLGAGGMGEVYRARDTKLGREVAIKILPESFVQDRERLARFEREAKVLAALNHPSIATLYGWEESNGSPFLVMELVEGETLSGRIARGVIPISEALQLFTQIADALEAAHDKGIIHRDLKPANIMITPDGKVKVLDFGLAKAFASEDAPSDAGSQSPTLTKGTALGAILGTASYMSPEQARGKLVDKRTDVWAFGCCLYEALAGQKAFAGETPTDTISAVVRAEPQWDRLPADTPAAIRKLLRRSMTKERNERLADIADARLEIREALAAPETDVEPAPGGRRGVLSYAGVAGVTALMVGLGVWSLTRPVPEAVTRLVILLPDGQRLVERLASPIALSPDGRRLVYAAESGDVSQLYLRELDSFEPTPIAGTEGGHTPFFAPDGEWVGFFAEDALKKVAVSGGAATVLAPVVQGLGAGGSWGRSGTIVYAPSAGSRGGLMQVSQGGGTPTQLADRGQFSQFAPDGETVVYSWATGSDGGHSIVSVSAGEDQTVGAAVGATYLPTGHMLYPASLSSLVARPFDLGRREALGEAVTVLDHVVVGRNRAPYLAVSDSGTLAFVSGEGTAGGLVVVERDGSAETIVRHDLVHAPRFSPDGRQVAYDTQPDIWSYDLDRETRTRLTVDLGQVPAWSPDGRRLAFHADGTIYGMPADASRDAEVLLAPGDRVREPTWSHDGKTLAFVRANAETGDDLWILPDDDEPKPFLVTANAESAPRFSPDGRFIAYQSNESGEHEIYVRSFPGPGGKWQVSSDGGMEPVWSRDGKEIFYRHRRALMVVDVETGDTFNAGRPRMLLAGDFGADLSGHPSYDVSPDGGSFVMIQETRDEPLTEIRVVLNWFDEIERLVPAH